MNTVAFMPNRNMLSWEPERLCDYIRQAGYDGIEVQAELLCADSHTDAWRTRFLRAVEAAELKITEIVLQRDFVLLDEEMRKKQIAYVIRNLRKLTDCGIGIVNMFTGPEPWLAHPVIVGQHVSEGTAWEWVFEAFDQVLPVAEACNIKIAVENVFCMLVHNLYTNKFLQSRYDSRLLGVNLDPSHDVLDGLTDMKFLVNSWGAEKIFHVHLKDAAGIQAHGRFLFPLLGEGDVNWKSFFGALKEIGYQGAMSVEFESWAYLANMLDDQYERAAVLCREAVSKLMLRAQEKEV